MISGYQLRNRRSISIIPREGEDQRGADQLSKLVDAAMRGCSGYSIISDAFYGSLITGLNLLHVWVDYRSDPLSGEIKLENCSYNNFYIDPFFKKADLSDCNAIWRRSYLTKEACINLMPEKKSVIDDLSNLEGDNKFRYTLESTSIDKDLLIYDEFYYRDYRKQIVLADSELGETIEWTGDDEALEEFLSLHPQIVKQETTIPTVKLAILVCGKVLYNDVNPLGIDDYPFVPVFCYFNPEVNDFSLKIRGMVRGLRDVQYLYNRMKILQLSIIESKRNSGWIVKEGALVNEDDVLRPSDGGVITLKHTAEMSDLQPIITQEFPQSYVQITQLLNDDFPEISGATDELLGSSVDEKSGAALLARQRAGLTTLQPFFSKLDASQELLGKMLIKVIQKNYTPGKVKRIVNEEPINSFYTKAFRQYDVIVTEGFDTASQKESQYLDLVKLRTDVGVQIPDETIINAASIQNKEELINALKVQQQQQQELEQLRDKFNLEEQQATTEMMRARAQSDVALSGQRKSSVQSDRFDMVYKTAEAGRKEQESNIKAIEALKSLNEVDITKVKELIELSRLVQEERVNNSGLGEEDEQGGGLSDSLQM